MTRRLTGAFMWRDIRIDLSYRLPWAMDVIALVALLAIYFYIVRYTHARAPGASNFFSYIVPGLAIIRFVVGLGRTVTALDREQSSGTLELLLSAPARSWAIIGAASVYELVRSFLSAGAVLILGRWVFGAGLTLGPHAWAALGLGLIGTAAFFLALTGVTCAVLIAFKQGLALAGLLALAIPVTSGIYFSPHVLPAVLRGLTSVLPVTLAVEVVRAGVVSATFPLGKVLAMFAEVLICLPLAALAIEAGVGRARRLGTLGQY